MSQTTLDRNPSTTDTDQSPRVKHIVPKDQITEAYVLGTPVTALCGFVFVPSRDPENYPLCQACKEAYDRGERPPRRDEGV